MFTLTPEQIEAFEGASQEHWYETAAHDLHEAFAEHYAAMGSSPEALIPVVSAVAKWARRHDVTGKADVTRFCYVAASLGHRFWQDPRFQGYVTGSMSPDVPRGRRASIMMSETKTWLRGLWAGDSLRAFSERLVELVGEARGPEAHTLRYLLPGHWQMFSAADNERLLAWLAQLAPEEVRDEGPRQLMYTACALVHGTRWLSDPQYPRLIAAIHTHRDPAALASTLKEIYAEATA